MAIFPFFKQRRPRGFDHKPIYWNPDKEKLQRRVAEVRRRMEEAGELPTSGQEAPSDNTSDLTKYDAADRIRGTFVESTQHAKRQYELRAAGKGDRLGQIVKIAIALIAAGAIIWILRAHFHIFI